MYIAGRTIHSNGKVYERGHEICEVGEWPPYVRQAHISCGSVMDLTPAQAKKLQKEMRDAGDHAKVQSVKKRHGKLVRKHEDLVAEIAALKKTLAEKKDLLKEMDEQMKKVAAEAGDGTAKKTKTKRKRKSRAKPKGSQVRVSRETGGGGAVAVTAAPPPETATAAPPPKTAAAGVE